MSLRNISNPAGSSLPDVRTIELTISDLDRIVALERATWPRGMRASREVIASRLEMDHGTIGLETNGELLGLVASRFARFDPQDRDAFPVNHHAFANQPHEPDHNAAFVYTLQALPVARGYGVPQQLMLAGRKYTLEAGCYYVVGDARCASFNGSENPATERIRQNPRFQAAVREAVTTGQLPPLEELIRDPVLRFYHRVLMCTFAWVIPDYFPDDEPSGGHGIIFYNEYPPE